VIRLGVKFLEGRSVLGWLVGGATELRRSTGQRQRPRRGTEERRHGGVLGQRKEKVLASGARRSAGSRA